MSNLIKTVSHKKNKNGKILQNIMNIEPKEGYINIEYVDDLYKKLKDKTDVRNIMIKIVTVDGFKTYKAFGDEGGDEPEYTLSHSTSKTKPKKIMGFQVITKPGF